MNRIILILIFLLMVSCGTLNHLNIYKNQPISTVEKDFGKPTSIIPTKEGKLYVYQTQKALPGMKIDKGEIYSDPMLSPAVNKTERTIFIVQKGIVVKVRKETEYERK